MASPTARNSTTPPHPSKRLRLRKPPLVIRRFGAWAVEVSLIAVSAIVPYSIGEYARIHSETQVPLNPVLAVTEEAIAKTLALPATARNDRVAPLTNLFWSVALAAPLLAIAWQLYLLGTTGKTSPKRWFGVRVIAPTGETPGIGRAFVREGIGRWGLPLGMAYAIWRYSGAFPDLGILTGLSGLMVLAEVLSGRFNPHQRSLHDRIAGTYVISEGKHKNGFYPYPFATPISNATPTTTAIVLTPESARRRRSLWYWMRENPGMTLLFASLAGMTSILGTFVGTQVYVQSQANRREFKQQDDQLYLQLVNQLNQNSAGATAAKREAILALGTLNYQRALQFLVDLLGQETAPETIEAIQQALVSSGPEALPFLQRLNQAQQAELDSLQPTNNSQQQKAIALRLRASKAAIAKILTIYNGQKADLSRVQLGRTPAPIAFTLVLDRIDLSGIQLRSALLSNASFKGSRFYSAGDDQRIGTFDDWIADLSGADLREANFSNATLNHVLLNRTNLIRAIFNNANLEEANLNGANLSSAQLIGASLQGANLENASFTGADLAEANLTQTNLRGARLGQLKAVATQFQFADLRKTEWQGADLSSANLSSTQLENADFSSAKLTGANLSNAQLKNANFRKADLSLVDLRGANLDGADFQDAIFKGAEKPKQDEFMEKSPAGASAKRLQGVNFTPTQNLSPEQIEYICAQGGVHPQCSL